MIINVGLGTFGGALRLGDLLGVANVLCHFRTTENNDQIKFHLRPNAVSNTAYVQEFYQWLLANTDFYSTVPGEIDLPWQRVNIWDYRDISGDLVKIENKNNKTDKIVVAPLFDAAYNTYRNWTSDVFDRIIDWANKNYSDHDLVILAHQPRQVPKWRTVTKLTDGLLEIMTARIYVGGDTGLSHFAGCLTPGPDPEYYYSSRSLIHATPLHWPVSKRGQMHTYWRDFENTKW